MARSKSRLSDSSNPSLAASLSSAGSGVGSGVASFTGAGDVSLATWGWDRRQAATEIIRTKSSKVIGRRNIFLPLEMWDKTPSCPTININRSIAITFAAQGQSLFFSCPRDMEIRGTLVN
ncbi:MAG: hypothetical protein ACREEM_29790 [Blastocatellia bacterium]